MPDTAAPPPATVGRPAARAFEAAGYRTIADLDGAIERQLLALHGVGPRAIKILREHGVKPVPRSRPSSALTANVPRARRAVAGRRRGQTSPGARAGAERLRFGRELSSVAARRTQWPLTPAAAIGCARLQMEPLGLEHARELFHALNDEGLHVFIGGHPATEAEMAARVSRQVRGVSSDGSQGWCNWVGS